MWFIGVEVEQETSVPVTVPPPPWKASEMLYELLSVLYLHEQCINPSSKDMIAEFVYNSYIYKYLLIWQKTEEFLLLIIKVYLYCRHFHMTNL